MIITCDECNSSFSVSESQIKDTGSKVRCSKCNSIFIAYPQSTEDIEGLETAEKELTLDSEDQMLADDKSSELEEQLYAITSKKESLKLRPEGSLQEWILCDYDRTH